MGKEDDERFWNLMIYKVYATDKEMAEMAPWLLGSLVVIGACVGLFFPVRSSL